LFLPCLICADRVFGPSTTTDAVYDVAARPVVKGAMEGINGISLLNIKISDFFYELMSVTLFHYDGLMAHNRSRFLVQRKQFLPN
jgi:hypothetical protein